MQLVNNEFKFYRDDEYIKYLLEDIAPNGYEINYFHQSQGRAYNFDGIIGYLKKPRINMEIKANGYIYKLNFVKDDYGTLGQVWYLYIDQEYRSKIRLFQWSKEKFLESIRKYTQTEKFDMIKEKN